MKKIAAILSFCSNDYRFFDRCIAGLRPFASQIIVTVCDHFFDGKPENYAWLESIYQRYPEVLFIEFAYSSEHSYHYTSPWLPSHPLWRHEWHNTGRWIAYFFVDPSIEYLYFCDGDEIVEGNRLSAWLSTQVFESYSAIRFACYWYFRQAHYRATVKDDMSLLVRKDLVDPAFFWSEHERMGLYLQMPGLKIAQVSDAAGIPFVHHYSWVRTKEEMDKKFGAWGHFWERDWQALVAEEYSRPFNGEDFIRHYQYEEIEPLFDPLLIEVPAIQPLTLLEHLENLSQYPQVKRVTHQEMFRRELQAQYDLTT